VSALPGSAAAGFGPPVALGSYLLHQLPAVVSLVTHQLVVTSPYGTRSSGFHGGVDLRARTGTPVVAPAGGVVKTTYNSGSCGYGVQLVHSSAYETLFCHLSRIDVAPGQEVKAGQQIGLSGGDPGTVGAGSSSAAHIHFEVRYNGSSVDPVPLVDWYPFALDYSSSLQAAGRVPVGYSFATQLLKVKARRMAWVTAVSAAAAGTVYGGYRAWKRWR